MSKIDKLSISGVRSFSPLGRETIQFNSPLTLIVGYNGSGKTTIIECLKYATTGEQPPNSKGGAFIHDPKLCGEREVLAQVKLKFSTPPETSYVVARNLQLTIKRTQRSMKTLEGSLMVMRHGEKNTQSSKVAELDKSVPDYLGVAPAILETVIFCHQDESLWPMSEPTALKKKFDEIFEAQKYTKAIDNLKVLRRKLGEKLQTYRIEESTEKTNKEKADRTEKRSIVLQDEIEKLRIQCDEAKEQMNAAAQSAREKHEQANNFLGIVNELRMKTGELKYRQDAIEELKANIDELDESDEWLEDTLAKYEDSVGRYETDLEENKVQYGEHQRELQKNRTDHAHQLAEQGKHRSDKEKYERQLASRVELIQQAAQTHGIRGFDGQLDDRHVKQFNDRIQKLLNDKKRDLDHLQKENAEEVDKKAAVITELEGKKASQTQDRYLAKQRVGALEKRINSVQNELNSLDIDEGAKVLLDAALEDLDKRFWKATEDLQTADLDAKMRQESNELVKVEAEHDRLGEELMECTRLAHDRAQLDYRKSELSRKKQELATRTSTWTDKLASMIGDWTPANVEREFQTALQVRTRTLEEATRKREDAVQTLRQVQFSLTSTREKLRRGDEELERCRSAVRNALREINPEKQPIIEDLNMEIEKLEEEILIFEKDINLFDEMDDYYKKCQKTLNKYNKCQLCDRVFGDLHERSRIAKKIQDALSGEQKEKTREDLAVCEEQLGQLRAVRPQFDTCLRLSSEKPGLDKEVQMLNEKEDQVTRMLEELDQLVNQKKEDRQDLESMTKTITSISQLHREIEEAQTQVDRITSQQSAYGELRSADEIKELQMNCTEQMKYIKNRINKLQADKQRLRDLVNSLELEKSQMHNKVSHAARELQRKKDFQKQIQAHRDDMSQQRDIISQADKLLESVEPDIAKARAIRDDTLQRGRAKEKRVADERDELAASVNELKMVEADIRDYLDRGGSSNLAANERAIKALNNTISRIETDMSELTARTNKLREDISNSSRKKKNIQDNLNYRKNLRLVAQFEKDIEVLESRNANEDYERHYAEAQHFETLRDRLNAERGAWMGAMKTKDEELLHLLEEWKTDYQDAARNYRKAHINVETTKAAIEDLGRYGSALDNAIMQYHSLKMEEVNRIAGDLWTQTYQGTDIDTILIRADNEAANSTSAVRRSYNYRVCMVKQDTEMDMRGRCSAGQRVLASIIIRLALAESFGTNCGLIALDEPTTNLDRDNIKALAESLHTIIKNRQAQSNFQLIVITHDEEFLRHMRCSDFCDTFYRVQRNENQNSTISLESITKVL